jgi:hypothetical protein
MTDISVFKQILERPDTLATGKVIWIVGQQDGPGRYIYRIGCRGWPIAELSTFNLDVAREAAAQLAGFTGRVVKEAGLLEAFGRHHSPTPPSAATAQAFRYLLRHGTDLQIRVWLSDHAEYGFWLRQIFESESQS